MAFAPQVALLLLFASLPEDAFSLKTAEGLQHVEQARAQTKFTVTDTRINKFSKPNLFVTKNTYNAWGGSFVLRYSGESATDGSGPFSTITAANPDYSFVIEKFSGQEWAMKDLIVNAPDPFATAQAKATELKRLLMPDAMIFVRSWESIVAEPSFRITRSEDQGSSRTISYTTSGPFQRGFRILKGKSTIDAKFGLIQSYEATIEFKSKETYFFVGKTTYQDPINGVPIPKSSEYEQLTEPAGDLIHSMHYEYGTTSAGDLSRSEAKLSAYGLSEPDLPNRSSVPVWAWLVGAGVVCFVAAAFIRLKPNAN